ncbi:MAG TPA: PaaI family thioesterase [Streptosporangiaceae bacterium]|jgi:1,4-dihydroxy-2-naphthoyl-CoA hydrolase|nr:PaaI family thioesterase [Streptosporangiaceae bacterium]
MPEDLAQLTALMPFASQLGITVLQASAERVVAVLPWKPELCTTGGVMHGGVLMSLADTIGALAVYLTLGDDETTATITSTTQMFRPVTGGRVKAEATVLHRGRTTATAQTSLFDTDSRLVSQTTQIQAIRKA